MVTRLVSDGQAFPVGQGWGQQLREAVQSNLAFREFTASWELQPGCLSLKVYCCDKCHDQK